MVFGALAQIILNMVKDLGPVQRLMELLRNITEPFKDVLQSMLESILPIITMLIAELLPVIEPFIKIIQDVFLNILNGIKPALDFLKPILDFFLSALIAFVGWLVGEINKVVSVVLQVVDKMIDQTHIEDSWLSFLTASQKDVFDLNPASWWAMQGETNKQIVLR